jgi:hypothetical protein
MRSLCIAAAVLLGLVSADFYNNVPIPGRRPAYTTGNSTEGIEFEMVYDLMCSDSAALDPEFQKFLGTTWNVTNKLVNDSISVAYTYLPLPYHHEAWLAHKLVPYFLDNCQFGPRSCQFLQYQNFCFQNQEILLDGKDKSENVLVNIWTNTVSAALNIPQAELLTNYNNAYDTHNSEMRTREMYKWNSHHHVSGTPFAFVNGVLLENFPEKADDWMTVLISVYNSQYRPKSASRTDL